MIVDDDYIEDMWKKYDKAKQKSWDDFFDKHFNQGKTMTEVREINSPMSLAEIEKLAEYNKKLAEEKAAVEVAKAN